MQTKPVSLQVTILDPVGLYFRSTMALLWTSCSSRIESEIREKREITVFFGVKGHYSVFPADCEDLLNRVPLHDGGLDSALNIFALHELSLRVVKDDHAGEEQG